MHTYGDLVSVAERVLHADVNIGDSASQIPGERFKFGRAMNVGFGIAESVCDACGMEKFIDCFLTALCPDLCEPALNACNIRGAHDVSILRRRGHAHTTDSGTLAGVWGAPTESKRPIRFRL